MKSISPIHFIDKLIKKKTSWASPSDLATINAKC